MDQTANLQLPYIMPSQAQKHVTHNEAIRALDALVQLAILDRDLSTPPGSPAEGDRYLVAATGSGAWTGKDGKVAAWQDGAWTFLTPRPGWLIWTEDETRLLSFNGTAWIDAALHGVNPVPLVGVNAIADATDRLSVKSPASLFDQESGDHRLKINKAAAGDTASLLFQSGYSGRAEFGLTGDDDWHVKVSPDGSTWAEALKVDVTTGRVRLPTALPLSDDNQIVAKRHVREILTANRTYFVRTDGNDANTGLANTSGGAFLTVQKAIDTALSVDMSIYTVTISIGAGTFAQNLTITGNGNARIVLSGASYSTTTVGSGAGTQISVSGSCRVTVQHLSIAAGGTVGLWARLGAQVFLAGSVQFNGATARLIGCDLFAYVENTSGTIYLNGNSPAFLRVHDHGALQFTAGVTVVTTAARAISTVVQVPSGWVSLAAGLTWNETAGAITGKRYDVTLNGVLNSAGGTIPGTIAGTTATGGQYV